MVTHTATANQAADFLQHLINNPLEREKFQDATAADIVQAGSDAGYTFTESDLNALIQHGSSSSTTPTPGIEDWRGEAS